MKRSFDLFFAAAGLIILSPLFAVLALVVKCSDGGPVLFRQERVGQAGRRFWIVKFRTMIPTSDDAGLELTLDRDLRVTRVGRFLRKSKLDELPQLWNVLVGDMSFVGPRPEVLRYVNRYTAEQRRILNLKPGITDVATLEFRDEEELLRKAETKKRKSENRKTGKQNGEVETEKAESGKRKAEINGSASVGSPSSHGPMVNSRLSDSVEDFYMEHCVPRKIELSLAYAARANLLSDIAIILRTVLGRRGNAVETLQAEKAESTKLKAETQTEKAESGKLKAEIREEKAESGKLKAEIRDLAV